MRPAQAVGRASSSRAYRAALRFATWWLRRYTRGVDPRFAADRESEVMFELWEHAIATDQHWSATHAAASLALRTAAGIPRDWSWRRTALRDGDAPALLPVRPLIRRGRRRFWVPLQDGHVFDQTNGMIEPEKALPHEPGNDSLGAAGNAFGVQGGF
jgi:hypothetical protein